jgi:hypothetical protein
MAFVSDENLKRFKENCDNTYLKQDDVRLNKVYVYQGTVSKYENLPADNVSSGDVYNVEETGMNYAAIVGEDKSITWDSLGSTFDVQVMSNDDIDALFTTTEEA